jgi:hypothetical protein
MKATIIFLISIVFQTTIQLQIKEEVFYCNKTNIILNWKLPCNSSSSHSNCVHLSNFRTMLNRDQDKYNFIYLSTQKDVVYSNGEIFKTNCSILKEFEIVEKIDKCTSDILVKIFHRKMPKFAFLTKEGILRNSSFQIPCSIKKQFFTIFLQKYKIFTFNKQVQIVKFKPKVEYFNFFNTSIRPENYSFQNIIDFYRQYIHQNIAVQLSEDGILFFILFFFIFSSKEKINLSHLFENISKIKNMKILQKKKNKTINIEPVLLEEIRVCEDDIPSDFVSNFKNKYQVTERKFIGSNNRCVRFVQDGRVANEKKEFICPNCTKEYSYKKRFENHVKFCVR